MSRPYTGFKPNYIPGTLRREYLTQKFLDRFWARVNKNGPTHPVLGTECWLWTGSIFKDVGYGQVQVTFRPFVRSPFGTHVVAWVIENGELPEGLDQVLHHCDVRLCCRPLHLYPGNYGLNAKDRVARNRQSYIGNPKLTAPDVITIRKLLPSVKQREIASRFGVTQSAISSIARRDTWKDL